MKEAKVKYLYLHDVVEEGIIFDSVNDIEILKKHLKVAERGVLVKFVKSGESPERLNHIVGGFSGLERLLGSYACLQTGLGKTSIYELGNISNSFLRTISDYLTQGRDVFMNSKGGISTLITSGGEVMLEIIKSSKIEYIPIKPKYHIFKKTKYIVLENDSEVEYNARKYLESVDRNYSVVVDLLSFSRPILERVFSEFVNNGGEVVYVYTTGLNHEQMYEYAGAAINSGVKKFEFYFNSGMDTRIDDFLTWLKSKYGISVKVLN